MKNICTKRPVARTRSGREVRRGYAESGRRGRRRLARQKRAAAEKAMKK
jgi:hypothetical protein